jgi:hypothetical protein
MEKLHKQFRFDDWTASFDSLNMPEHVLKSLKDFEDSESFNQFHEKLKRLHDLDVDRLRDFGNELNGRQGYFEALRNELIRDGYLSKKEEIESMEWSNDHFRVNGKDVKEADRKKYQELNEKYKQGGRAPRVE